MRFVSVVKTLVPVLLILPAIPGNAQLASSPGATADSSAGVSVSVYQRSRVESWQWFAAPPQSETYGYAESLLRIGAAGSAHKFEWKLELSQPSVLWVPGDAVSPVAAQGQLGLGATYYVANGNQQNSADAFLKQAFLSYNAGQHKNLRVGRFEFFDGLETKPANRTLAWLQTNRIAQRLVGNFGFSAAQRSFDGVDGHYGSGTWDVTAMAARADQGVFNMNGNPELNVDVQYLALTHAQFHQHVLWRAFALGYHDGRTGITKTDNRPLAARQADHANIRIGTYGGDLIASTPVYGGQVDFLAWGAFQKGRWGMLQQDSKAGALEGGYQFLQVATSPWLRGGYFFGSGDTTPDDNRHQTFFQVLPTPWLYAQFPFYNLMNNKDGFVQIMDQPTKRIDLRADLHWVQLASRYDLWYLSGGAFDNSVFGYVGRPSGGFNSLATVANFTSSWQVSKRFAVNLTYARAGGKSVAASIYPTGRTAQYGYAEVVYKWDHAARGAH